MNTAHLKVYINLKHKINFLCYFKARFNVLFIFITYINQKTDLKF